MIIAVHAADAHLLSKFFLFSRVSLLSLVNSFLFSWSVYFQFYLRGGMVPKRKNVIMIIMLVMCFFGRDGRSPPDVGKPSHPGQLGDNKRPL